MRDYYSYIVNLSKNMHQFSGGKEWEGGKSKKTYRHNLQKEDFSYNETTQSVIYINAPWNNVEASLQYYIDFLHQVLTDYIGDANSQIMIVGLGNQFMVADSLGMEIAKQIIPTRHLEKKPKGASSISVFIPNVLGVTGIESADAVNAMCNIVKPDTVIALDALCATSLVRFAKTIQLSNGGITPGAGVANARKKLKPEALGCKVVAVGVPLLLKEVWVDGQQSDMFFTSADIDEKVRLFSAIIAGAINKFVLE